MQTSLNLLICFVWPKKLGLSPKHYAVITLHKPSNVDDMEKFSQIIAAFEEIQNEMKLVFPIHSHARDNIKGTALERRAEAMANLLLIEPAVCLDFLCLMGNAALVFTDLGGIQEETTILGIPCMTLRESTQQPATTTEGTNQLVHITTEDIVKSCHQIVGAGKNIHTSTPRLCDGKAAQTIVRIIAEL